MIPAWVDQYIGVPFLEYGRDPKGWDCWGCLRWCLAKHYGIEIPAFDGKTWHEPPIGMTDREKVVHRLRQSVELSELMQSNITQWREIEKPYPGCGVLMRPHRHAMHVGLVVDVGVMLHIEEGCHTVCVPYDGLMWKNRVEGFYEWAG